MADGNPFPHPAIERIALRRKMAAAVDQLLDAVDLLVRELDGETPDADMEPSLGAPEYLDHIRGIDRGELRDDLFRWAKGLDVGEREADADLEPSLAVTSRRHIASRSQLFWEQAGWGAANEDYEQEHDGREPSLGSVAAQPWDDQRRWAAGGDQGEREDACEDEGAQCDDKGSCRDGDDEPDGDGEGRSNPVWEIGGRPMWRIEGDRLTRVDPDDEPGEFVERIEVGLV